MKGEDEYKKKILQDASPKQDKSGCPHQPILSPYPVQLLSLTFK